MASRAPRVHAAKVSSVLYLETVLKMGEYSLMKKKFGKPLTHAEIARHFRYSCPQTSYSKYTRIRKMIMKQSSGAIKLPHIRVNDIKPAKTVNEYEQLMTIVNRF